MKKRNKIHEHTVKTINIEKKLYELFIEKYPFINFSLFIELCMREALKLKGINYKLIEDEIFEGKIKTTAKKLEKILQHLGLIQQIDFNEQVEIAHKEAETLKQSQYESDN